MRVLQFTISAVASNVDIAALNAMSEDDLDAALCKDPSLIQYIKNPSRDIIMLALEQSDGAAIQYIKNPSKNIQSEALEYDTSNINFIENPSIELQLYAIRNGNYSTFEFFYKLSNPDARVIESFIVNADPFYIGKVENQSEELQIAAIEKAVSLFGTHRFFSTRSKEATLMFIKNIKETYGVKGPDDILKFLKNPSKKVLNIYVHNFPKHMNLIGNPDIAFYRELINNDPGKINSIKDKAILEELIKEKITRFRHIDRPTIGICRVALSIEPELIAKMKNPNKELQEIAVKKEPAIIKSITNPDKEVLRYALGTGTLKNLNTNLLTIIKEDESLKELAVLSDLKASKVNIDNPEPLNNKDSIKLLSIIDHTINAVQLKKLSPELENLLTKINEFPIQFIQNPTEQQQLAAVVSNPDNLRYLKNPSEALQLAALKKGDFSNIRFIQNPTEAVQEYAITKSIRAIAFIKNPSEKIQMLSVNKQPTSLESIIDSLRGNPSEAVQLAAITKDYRVIRYLINPSSAIQIAALKVNTSAANYINNLSPTAQAYLANSSRLPSNFKDRTLLPKGLNNDQLAILRWMDLNNTHTISVKELKTNFTSSPEIQRLIKLNNGKDLTRDQVKLVEDQSKSELLSIAIQNSSILSGDDWRGAQTIFKKPNKVFILQAPIDVFRDHCSRSELDALNSYIKVSNHPRPKNSKYFSLGWVRYTVFGKDIWIDEIQSDIVKEDVTSGRFAMELKSLPDEILNKFIREMRRRGFQKFFMPTHEMKTGLYKAKPPISLYKDVPRKARFKMDTIQGIDSKVNGKEAWVLAKTK